MNTDILREMKYGLDHSYEKQGSFIKSLPISKAERTILLKDLDAAYIKHLKLIIYQFDNGERERAIPKVFQKTERIKDF